MKKYGLQNTKTYHPADLASGNEKTKSCKIYKWTAVLSSCDHPTRQKKCNKCHLMLTPEFCA